MYYVYDSCNDEENGTGFYVKVTIPKRQYYDILLYLTSCTISVYKSSSSFRFYDDRQPEMSYVYR